MTDQAINLSGDKRIIETVVDSTYKTKSGALNKVGHLFLLIFVICGHLSQLLIVQARALQYCLEEDNNILEDDAWIVHLDEETLLTEASVRGIMNFITADKHSFGQGIVSINITSSRMLSRSIYILKTTCKDKKKLSSSCKILLTCFILSWLDF